MASKHIQNAEMRALRRNKGRGNPFWEPCHSLKQSDRGDQFEHVQDIAVARLLKGALERALWNRLSNGDALGSFVASRSVLTDETKSQYWNANSIVF